MNPYDLKWLNALLEEIRPSVFRFTQKDFVSITIFVHSINRKSRLETLMSCSQDIGVYPSQPSHKIYERKTEGDTQRFDSMTQSLRQDSSIQISNSTPEYHVAIYVPNISDETIKGIILEAIHSKL